MVNSGVRRESLLKERLEKVLGLTQCLSLHRTKPSSSFYERRKLLLEVQGRLDQFELLQLALRDHPFHRRGWPRAQVYELGEVQTGNTPPRVQKALYGHAIEWIKSDNLAVNGLYPLGCDKCLVHVQSNFALLDVPKEKAKDLKQIVVCRFDKDPSVCNTESQPIFVDIPKDSTDAASKKPTVKNGSITLGAATVLIDGTGLDQVISVSYAGTKVPYWVTTDKPPQLQVDLSKSSVWTPSIVPSVNLPFAVEFTDKSVNSCQLTVKPKTP